MHIMLQVPCISQPCNIWKIINAGVYGTINSCASSQCQLALMFLGYEVEVALRIATCTAVLRMEDMATTTSLQAVILAKHPASPPGLYLE